MHPRYRPWLASATAAGIVFGWLVAAPSPAPSAVMYQDAPPAGRTGAPGETTCASCHSGGLNDGQGTLAISGIPSAYVPGTKYSVTVSLGRAGQSRWGFEVTSLRSSDGAMAGTLAAPSNLTQILTKTTRTYVAHISGSGPDGTFAGTVNGPVSWTFDWTAPAAGNGAVTFYLVGVAADNDGNDGAGDLVYTTTASYTEEVPTAVHQATWGWIKANYR